MRTLLARARRDTDAQDLFEYALLVALVGLIGIAAWSLIRTNLGTRYQRYDTKTQELYVPKDPIK
jgi:Flp pilus assembly pilin Flp